MKLRFAMIGGALDSFMGPVHRLSAMMDGDAEMVAGSFSRRDEKNRAAGERWHIPVDHLYTDYRELLAEEAHSLDYVIICTPNSTHIEIATAAIEAGLSVACDKPLDRSLEPAVPFARFARDKKALMMVTHNYSGYPMIREARVMCAKGELGTVQRVVVEMPQGWLQGMIATAGREPEMWRLDPAIVGPSLAMADVGTHAHHLTEFVTGLRVTSLFAEKNSYLQTSTLENDANLLMRFENGASGVLMVSEIALGDRNPFRLRVYGTKLGIEWIQEYPERLVLKEPSGNERILYRGHSADAESTAWSRIPIGHPEGYLEAFANLYSEFHRAVLDRKANRSGTGYLFPTIDDGVRGLRFVQAALTSYSAGRWTEIDGGES